MSTAFLKANHGDFKPAGLPREAPLRPATLPEGDMRLTGLFRGDEALHSVASSRGLPAASWLPRVALVLLLALSVGLPHTARAAVSPPLRQKLLSVYDEHEANPKGALEEIKRAASLALSAEDKTALLLMEGFILASMGNRDGDATTSFMRALTLLPDAKLPDSLGITIKRVPPSIERLFQAARKVAQEGKPTEGPKRTGPAVRITVEPDTSSKWRPTESMSRRRHLHTATLLISDEVLVTGGYDDGVLLADAERYDPEARIWRRTEPMKHPRAQHTATRLKGGKVLVAGGYGSTGFLAGAELYDPARHTWTAAGRMSRGRSQHTATLLNTGEVLVTGGKAESGPLANAELYNPETNTWKVIASMTSARNNHTATLMPSGKVLVTGGGKVEVYDPAKGEWSAANSVVGSGLHTATLLPSGKVLLVGELTEGNYRADAATHNPKDGSWETPVRMHRGRARHAATLLRSGKVLVTGGSDSGNTLAGAELYDPVTLRWTPLANMAEERTQHTATLLTSGEVLVAGGYAKSSKDTLSSAEIYKP